MRYLLDTATLSNSFTMPAVLPARILSLVNMDEEKGFCGVSLIELAIHYRRGRLLVADLAEFFAEALAENIELLEITPEIAVATNDLPRSFPGDPFDRTIAATARVLDLTLITPDRNIRDSGFCRVEFYPFRLSRV